MANKQSILGDVRAEADSKMLDLAFYETPDYKTLLESSDRTIVVGRRGTGKSALAYKLAQHWGKSEKHDVVHLAAEEDQVIGIRPLIELFGNEFRLVRAGSRIAWRYALLLEIASQLSKKYKFKKAEGADILEKHLVIWRKNPYGFCAKLKDKLREVVDLNASPQARVSDLAMNLSLKEIEDAIHNILEAMDAEVIILVDKLDEGYEPDPIGIGLVDGLVQAIVDLNTKYARIRPILYLRDNIFRTVAKYDPDFSRNVEGGIATSSET